jgi:hypothetical protein
MEVTPPDCSEFPTPCSEENWVQCDRCYRYICEKHDYLTDVERQGTNPNRGFVRLCQRCMKSMWHGLP